MSLIYLRRSYSCVWTTRPKSRPREHVIWGTGVPPNLSPSKSSQRSFAEWRETLRLVPGAKLSGVERSNVGESDYRQTVGDGAWVVDKDFEILPCQQGP